MYQLILDVSQVPLISPLHSDTSPVYLSLLSRPFFDTSFYAGDLNLKKALNLSALTLSSFRPLSTVSFQAL